MLGTTACINGNARRLARVRVLEELAGGGFAGGNGISLESCRDGCLAEPSCFSIAYASGTGHCTPLSTVVTAASPIKSMRDCGCSCFATHYLGAPPVIFTLFSQSG